jgi:hypothetical protein
VQETAYPAITIPMLWAAIGFSLADGLAVLADRLFAIGTMVQRQTATESATKHACFLHAVFFSLMV